MKYISNGQQELAQKLLERRRFYGAHGDRYAERVLTLCGELGTNSVLDYGAGKGTLQRALGFPIQEYDPGVPDKSALPVSADIVICTGVLNYVERDRLEAVIQHVWGLTRKVLVLAIGRARQSKKNLADGRNAHLSSMPIPEWIELVSKLCADARIEVHDRGFVRPAMIDMTLWR